MGAEDFCEVNNYLVRVYNVTKNSPIYMLSSFFKQFGNIIEYNLQDGVVIIQCFGAEKHEALLANGVKQYSFDRLGMQDISSVIYNASFDFQLKTVAGIQTDVSSSFMIKINFVGGDAMFEELYDFYRQFGTMMEYSYLKSYAVIRCMTMNKFEACLTSGCVYPRCEVGLQPLLNVFDEANPITASVRYYLQHIPSEIALLASFDAWTYALGIAARLCRSKYNCLIIRTEAPMLKSDSYLIQCLRNRSCLVAVHIQSENKKNVQFHFLQKDTVTTLRDVDLDVANSQAFNEAKVFRGCIAMKKNFNEALKLYAEQEIHYAHSTGKAKTKGRKMVNSFVSEASNQLQMENIPVEAFFPEEHGTTATNVGYGRGGFASSLQNQFKIFDYANKSGLSKDSRVGSQVNYERGSYPVRYSETRLGSSRMAVYDYSRRSAPAPQPRSLSERLGTRDVPSSHSFLQKHAGTQNVTSARSAWPDSKQGPGHRSLPQTLDKERYSGQSWQTDSQHMLLTTQQKQTASAPKPAPTQHTEPKPVAKQPFQQKPNVDQQRSTINVEKPTVNQQKPAANQQKPPGVNQQKSAINQQRLAVNQPRPFANHQKTPTVSQQKPPTVIQQKPTAVNQQKTAVNQEKVDSGPQKKSDDNESTAADKTKLQKNVRIPASMSEEIKVSEEVLAMRRKRFGSVDTSKEDQQSKLSTQMDKDTPDGSALLSLKVKPTEQSKVQTKAVLHPSSSVSSPKPTPVQQRTHVVTLNSQKRTPIVINWEKEETTVSVKSATGPDASKEQVASVTPQAVSVKPQVPSAGKAAPAAQAAPAKKVPPPKPVGRLQAIEASTGSPVNKTESGKLPVQQSVRQETPSGTPNQTVQTGAKVQQGRTVQRQGLVPQSQERREISTPVNKITEKRGPPSSVPPGVLNKKPRTSAYPSAGIPYNGNVAGNLWNSRSSGPAVPSQYASPFMGMSPQVDLRSHLHRRYPANYPGTSAGPHHQPMSSMQSGFPPQNSSNDLRGHLQMMRHRTF